MKVLAKLGILLSLLGLSSIIGEYIYVQRTVTEEVPYTVQVVAGYRFSFPYEVVRISTVYNCSIDLRSPYTIITENFSFPLRRSIDQVAGDSFIVSWSSTRDILLFAVMARRTWLSLLDYLALKFELSRPIYQSGNQSVLQPVIIGELVFQVPWDDFLDSLAGGWEHGRSTVEALLRGEPVNQSVLLTLQDVILNEFPTIFSSREYRLNSSSGRLAGIMLRAFKIVVIDLNSTEGTVNVGIDHRCEHCLEMRDEPIYREETRYRTEERTVEEPLFVTPRIEGVEGNLLGFSSLLTGITLTVASSLRGRKPTS